MIQAKGLPGQSVIVVDTSASMQATDVSPSRLEAAKNRLRRFVQELNPGEQLAIVEAGAQVRVLASLTSDKQKLLNAISQIQPTDTSPIGWAGCGKIVPCSSSRWGLYCGFCP
jgi:Mg-chelatase subunit ChlD